MNEKKKGSILARVIANDKSTEGTVTVEVRKQYAHPKYTKIITDVKKRLVHYGAKQHIELGTYVEILPCSPKSKLKNFEIIKIVGGVNE